MAGVCGNILHPADTYFQKKAPGGFPPGAFLFSAHADRRAAPAACFHAVICAQLASTPNPVASLLPSAVCTTPPPAVAPFSPVPSRVIWQAWQGNRPRRHPRTAVPRSPTPPTAPHPRRARFPARMAGAAAVAFPAGGGRRTLSKAVIAKKWLQFFQKFSCLALWPKVFE